VERVDIRTSKSSRNPGRAQLLPLLLFPVSSFRKQDTAPTPCFIDESLIIHISTAICYYYCLYISLLVLPVVPKNLLYAAALPATPN
jgi:hypothetical protein